MTRHGHSKGDQQLWLWLHLFSKHGVETAHANGKHVDRRRPNPTNRGGGGEEAHRAQSLDERLCGPASSCRSVWSLWRRSHGDASEVRCECAEDSIGNNTPDAIRRAHATRNPKKALSAAIPSRLAFLLTQPSKRITHRQPQTTTRATHTRIIFLTPTARKHGSL